MGMWSKAAEMAGKAPPERNRYVDFLRALSIMAVVVGHWLVAAPYMKDGAVEGGHLLGILPWTQWLTWGFQVMPLFFCVGGFSNGVSWAATRAKGGTFSDWFGGRVQRLINPVMPLFLVWSVIAIAGTTLGIEREVVKMAAQLALIPVWFLAVYLIVSALVPFTHAAWQRWGMGSFWALVSGAVLVDWLSIGLGIPVVNWLNFLFVWLAIHQLGYAWQEGRFRQPLIWGLVSLAVLSALVRFGPYPVAMIGVPGNDLSNSMPPTLALLALGNMQIGLALALEPVMRRLLGTAWLWTATVLVNGMIMTVYLWHLTAFVLVMVAAWLMGGVGLDVAPGSADWWLARPVWFALYIAVTLPLIAIFSPFERMGSAAKNGELKQVPHWRLILGLGLICLGLTLTAAISIASPEGVTGLRIWVVALPFIGAALVGFGPAYTLAKRFDR
ncbi:MULTISPECIES: acyltransferase [unclassified Novosphingobium]|uniref:acyltransferase family protein n=1 Tax=unclassified Novosphingobium TaxID=2644732 RepID=UPI0025ECFC50|nr:MULTISPECIES: acyltransferase [unclassified Novosphingobium]HQV03650.1 acyltransferase [Novosphingobium sp.]